MAKYGSRPQDLVVDSRGNALRGVTLKLYDSEAAALAGGPPVATKVTDVRGRWSFEADGEVWARLLDGTVWQVAGPPVGGVTDHGNLNGLADDDHPQYALADGSRGDFEPTGSSLAAVAAHEGSSDPHPQYLTQAEGDALYSGGGGAAYQRGPAYASAAAQLAPQSFVKTYRVDPSETTSAALGVFSTIGAAITQAQADIKAGFTGASSDLSRTSPDAWRRILVEPGDYNETVALPGHTALVGRTGDPADVRVYHAGDTGSGAVLSTSGSTCHVSGITFEFTGTDEQWHPWRDSGSAGDVDLSGGKQRRTVTVDRCVFYTSNAAATAGSAGLDATIGGSTTLVVARSAFRQDNGTQVINVVLNSGSTGLPSTVVFLDTTVDCNHDQRTIMSAPVGDPWGPAAPVGLVDFGTGRGDRFYWQGGTFDVGNAVGEDGVTPAGVQGNIVASYQAISGSTISTVWTIDDEVPAGASWPDVYESGAGVAARVVRSRELPVLPHGGLSLDESEGYGQSSVPVVSQDSDLTMAPALSASRAALTANRIYYVRLPIERAFEVGQVTIGSTNGKGYKVASAIYLDDGTGTAPATDVNLRVSYSPITTAYNADRVVAGVATARRPIYPLAKYVWVAFVCESATPTFDTGTDQTDYPVKYQDGWGGSTLSTPSGLASLPGGTPFPLPTLTHYGKLSSTAYTTAGTFNYTVPPAARAVEILLIGGGGGGGSGRRGAASTTRTGGSGGGGGGVIRMTLPTYALGTTLTAFITGTGLGGAAVTTDDTNGAAGGAGGTVILRVNGVETARAGGGSGGGGGSAATVTGGGGGWGDTYQSNSGGAANNSGNGGGGNTGPGPGGGGGGGSISTSNTVGTGGAGGQARGLGPNSGASGGTNTGGVGGDGPSPVGAFLPGNGAGGGGANGSGAAGNGGVGGSFGAGGGGGGASVNGSASGAGGNGGPPLALFTPIF